MKPLLAVVTCCGPKYRARANAQRDTWVASAHEFDVRFFVGSTPTPEEGVETSASVAVVSDEIVLLVDDSYAELPAKVQAVCRWALAHGYTRMFRTDDDTYIAPAMLAAAPGAEFDYVGCVRGATGGFPKKYASGFAYWLSGRAMQMIANADLTEDRFEDRWVGNTLAAAGIAPVSDERSYRRVSPPLHPALIWSRRSQIGDAAVFCEFEPEMMHLAHKSFSALHKSYSATVRKPQLALVIP